MTILSLDPSSTCCGYAVLRNGDPIDIGLLRPVRAKDDPNKRIADMAAELTRLMAEYRPDRVVIEDTSGKVAKRHGGGGAGLAVYGKAIGYLMRTVEAAGIPCETVLENVWTRGKSKSSRQRAIAMMFRQYDAGQDKGGDAADAIGIGLYWFERERSRACLKP